jgi:hypothetical protein
MNGCSTECSVLSLCILAPMQKGALSTAEVCEALGMQQLKGRRWHVQGAVAIRGEGLYEGLDWLVTQCTACLATPSALLKARCHCLTVHGVVVGIGQAHVVIVQDCAEAYFSPATRTAR